jgi:ATP adenylyltransferase
VTDDPLWAPWRLAYIISDKNENEPDPPLELLEDGEAGCFLCMAAVDDDLKKRYVVYRSELIVAVLNLYPYNNGHVLVSPRRHVAELDQLTEAEELELSQTVRLMVRKLKKAIQPEGFNIGINLGHVAGAGLPGHLHWHIVPRWGGDTNFMPIVGRTNVIPQSLDILWGLMTE